MKQFFILRAAQAIKPHIPMIKFRRSQDVAATLGKTVSKGAPKLESEGQLFMSITEDQLPQRFRRQPLDERQITAINSGGCE